MEASVAPPKLTTFISPKIFVISRGSCTGIQSPLINTTRIGIVFFLPLSDLRSSSDVRIPISAGTVFQIVTLLRSKLFITSLIFFISRTSDTDAPALREPKIS